MQLTYLIFSFLMNGKWSAMLSFLNWGWSMWSIFYSGVIVYCINLNQLKSSSLIQSINLSTSGISIESNSSTTYRPYYPDTFSPGAIAGVAIGSFLLIFIISMGAYQIRRQRIYHIPYFDNYQPIWLLCFVGDFQK